MNFKGSIDLIGESRMSGFRVGFPPEPLRRETKPRGSTPRLTALDLVHDVSSLQIPQIAKHEVLGSVHEPHGFQKATENWPARSLEEEAPFYVHQGSWRYKGCLPRIRRMSYHGWKQESFSDTFSARACHRGCLVFLQHGAIRIYPDGSVSLAGPLCFLCTLSQP